MFRKPILLLCAAALAGTAQAQVLTTEFTNPLALANVNMGGSLALFDSHLGTLLGATLTLEGAIQATTTVSNGGLLPLVSTSTTLTSIDFSSSSAALAGVLSSNAELGFTISTGLQTFLPGVGYSVNTSPDVAVATRTYDLANVLSSLSTAGGGFVGLSCSVPTSIAVGVSLPILSVTQTISRSCGASISYDYEPFAATATAAPVPEPRSLALMLMGLAGIGVRRVRARRER